METKVEALQDNKVKVTVTVDAKEVDNRIKKAYKDFANKYNFPGFRKGKAPRPIIDNALGAEAVPASVTDDIVNGCYPLAIDSCDLYPVGEPEFGEPALVEGGKPYEFSFEVECKPTCELSDYEPVEVKLPAEGASEAEIDQQIEALRDYYHEFENANANTKVKADSYADLKIAATDENGEDVSTLSSESRMCLMGSGMFPAAFDEQVIGLKKGQTASFSVNVEDAKDATLMASLEGKIKTVNFEVEVLAVKKQVLPELTDEWVKDTLGFDDVADLREREIDPSRFVRALVTDPSLVGNRKEQLRFMNDLYCVASVMQDVDYLDCSFYDLFTPDELYAFYAVRNYQMYLEEGPSAEFGHRALSDAVPLLRNFVAEADEAIATGALSASLRYGHDVNVIPLVGLMGIEGCDTRESDYHKVDQAWSCWRVTPMATNIQLVFFRRPDGGDVLVKFLFNERESRIRLESDLAPYYRWNDVKRYFDERIATQTRR